MRNALLSLLLICSYPLFTQAQNNPGVYDHKIIAILPMRTAFATYSNVADSNSKALRTLELNQGIQLQEALYQSMLADTNRLLIAIQSWQTTDSTLTKAGVDLLKIPWLNISAIAKVLKVDACVVTTLRRNGPQGNIVGFTFSLMDGKSGDELWTFSQEVKPYQIELEKDKFVFGPQLFKKFKKRFPYCD